MLARLLFVTAQVIATLAIMLLTARVCGLDFHDTVQSYTILRARGRSLFEILSRLIDLHWSLSELLSADHVLAQSTVLLVCSGVWLAARRAIRGAWYQRLAGAGKEWTFDRAIAALAVTLVVAYVWVVCLGVIGSEYGLRNVRLWALFTYNRHRFLQLLVIVVVLLALSSLALRFAFKWRSSDQSAGATDHRLWRRASLVIMLGMPLLCAWVSGASGIGHFWFSRVAGAWLAIFAATVVAASHAWDCRSSWALNATVAALSCMMVLLGLWLPRQLPLQAVGRFVAFDMPPVRAPAGAAASALAVTVVLVWLVAQFPVRRGAGNGASRSRLLTVLSDPELRTTIFRRVVIWLVAPAVGLTFSATIGQVLAGGIGSSSRAGTWGATGAMLEVATPLLILVAVAVLDGIRRQDTLPLHTGFTLWCLAAVQLLLVYATWGERQPPMPILLILGFPALAITAALYAAVTWLLDHAQPRVLRHLDCQLWWARCITGLLAAWCVVCLFVQPAELLGLTAVILPWLGVVTAACAAVMVAMRIPTGRRVVPMLSSAVGITAFFGFAAFADPAASWDPLTTAWFVAATSLTVISWWRLSTRPTL